MKPSSALYCALGAALLGLELQALSDHRGDGSLSLFASPAHAQLPFEDCREAPVPGTLGEERYQRCVDGRYFKLVGGKYVETNRRGEILARPAADPAPAAPEAVEEPLELANPDFKKAPDPNAEGLDTPDEPAASGEPAFKKAPEN